MIHYVVLYREWSIGDTVLGVYDDLETAILAARASPRRPASGDALEVVAWCNATEQTKWSTDKDRKVG